MQNKNFLEWVLFFLNNNWNQLLSGTVTTLYVSLTGTIIGFLIGLVVALIKNESKNNIFMKFAELIANIYIAVFRGTPMIVQSMVIFYGSAQIFKINMNPIGAALFIVSINTGAYMSEIIRGGIEAIDNGQFEAAQAIGMTNFQMMKNIIFPQMFRNILPAMGNEFIVNIKDTSVLNVIGVTELFFISRSIAGTYSRYYEVFIITSVIYFVLTFTVSLILKSIEKRIDGPQNFEMSNLQMMEGEK